jgi:TPR repeat protein
MVFHLQRGTWPALLIGSLVLPCQAADVGGWFADQQKARAAATARSGEEGCPQVFIRAATDASPLVAYRAALCYLQAETPDVVAAKAWLGRSAEAGFMPAHRLLRSMQVAEAGAHGTEPHCHSIGEGQQICHGGSARPPLAATTAR